jgi:hypothetical protein
VINPSFHGTFSVIPEPCSHHRFQVTLHSLALFDHNVFDPLQRWILSESGLEFRPGVIQCILKPGCYIANLVEEELGP